MPARLNHRPYANQDTEKGKSQKAAQDNFERPQVMRCWIGLGIDNDADNNEAHNEQGKECSQPPDAPPANESEHLRRKKAYEECANEKHEDVKHIYPAKHGDDQADATLSLDRGVIFHKSRRTHLAYTVGAPAPRTTSKSARLSGVMSSWKPF
jgi:hypothetical protein